MKVEKYDYNLPSEKIAFYPPKKRGDTKLMVVNREGGSIVHGKYSDIIRYISKGDLIVLNNTKVGKVRLFFVDPLGKEHQALFLPSDGENGYKCLLGGSRGMSEGFELKLKADESISIILGKKDENEPIWEVELLGSDLNEIARKFGHVPLPPYIKRNDNNEDEKRYNTVFADVFGSSASPTASLNLTEDLLDQLSKKGVEEAFVTLDVGWGTFAPIRTESVEEHEIHSEKISIDAFNSKKINTVLENNLDVWAFGTTVCRVLESVVNNRNIYPFSGNTNLFIYPGYNWKVIDHLITNFHAPKTSLLTLVASFMGYELMMKAYNEALEKDYKFLSYGDSMLII